MEITFLYILEDLMPKKSVLLYKISIWHIKPTIKSLKNPNKAIIKMEKDFFIILGYENFYQVTIFKLIWLYHLLW